MPKVSHKNDKFCDKQTICRDMAFILNADVSLGTKYAVMNRNNWVWTEYYGKYRGCPYWSVKALKQFSQTGKIGGLRHEHAVPKKVINKLLLDLNPATAEEVRKIYDQCLVGVIVTLAEDRKLGTIYGKTMPTEFFELDSPDYLNPWLRYRLCNIKVTHMRLQLDALAPFMKKHTGEDCANLEQALYRHHWIDRDFDWSKWREAEEYANSPDKVATANLETIRRLFTVHFRKERFCEGHLNTMYGIGHIPALLARLQQIVKNKEYLMNFTQTKNS